MHHCCHSLEEQECQLRLLLRSSLASRKFFKFRLCFVRNLKILARAASQTANNPWHGWARPVPMSGNANTPADNGNGNSNKPLSLAIARETRVLSELAASVHTLESISQVLDQIAVLTGEPEEKGSSSGGAGNVGSKKKGLANLESIATKQMVLMEELGQWGKLLGGASTSV